MAMARPATAGDALDALIATQEAALIARTRRSHELHSEASAHLPGGVALLMAGRPAVPGVPRAWPGLPRVGCRRHRVRRPARRVRDDARRPRPPGDRVRRHGTSRCRHALRPTRARHHPGGHRARPALRPAVVAFRQLGHRVHARRHPLDARGDRPAPDHQGRGQLSRPPRRRAGLGLPRRRRRRPARSAARPSASTAPCRRRSPPSPTSCRSAGSMPSDAFCSTTRGRSPA